MTPPLANLINAATLIAMSAWAYLAATDASLTALIPGAVGLALLACHPGVKAEDKTIAHVAVLLTLLVFLALFMPLSGAIGRGDGAAILRTGLMLASSVLAMVYFIKSFRDARRVREQGGAA